MANKPLPIRIRDANESDIGFIFNSWLKSFRNAPLTHMVGNTIYYSEHHKVLKRLIPRSKLVVACNEEDPTQIYGYACGERVDGVFVIHYVYVKQMYRKLGIGKLMLNSIGYIPGENSFCTHWTRNCERTCFKYSIFYHPYILMNHLEYKVGYTDKEVEEKTGTSNNEEQKGQANE